jgi:glutamate 5-kinase
MTRSGLAQARRLVVKVGSSTIVAATGGIDHAYLCDLARQVATVRAQGRQVVIVSSGAIAAGAQRMGRKRMPRALAWSQAAAAVGQSLLMDGYAAAFEPLGVCVAQVLLTRADLGDRTRFVNAAATMETLLSFGAVPIVNENDTVSVEEITFGDNDTLAALVCPLVRADLLVLLSDVDGLYRDVAKRKDVIPEVGDVTPEIEALAGSAAGRMGRGGMLSKVNAARLAARCGVAVLLANGRESEVLTRLVAGRPLGTHFRPLRSKMEGRKQWLALVGEVRGRLVVNEGAKRRVVQDGKSLLAVGIVGVEGDFGRRAMVALVGPSGEEFARGMASYDADALRRVKGLRSAERRRVLGEGPDEVVHRDNMVVWG